MKLKTLLSVLWAAMLPALAAAQVAVSRPDPQIPEDERVISLPCQYYYFADGTDGEGVRRRQLHCYFPETRIDVSLDYFQPDYSYGSPLHAVWHDAQSDKVYLVDEEGGTEIRYLGIYEINSRNEVKSLLSLSGVKASVANDYDDSGDCHVVVGKDYVEVKGFDMEKEERVDTRFTLGMRKWRLPYPSDARIAPLGLGFLKMNAAGVNIRRRPSVSAPRLGYFRCRECEESDMQNSLMWEDEKGEPPFNPLHPDTSEIFACPLAARESGGWQAVHVEGFTGYVADRLVTRLAAEPISMEKPLADDWLQKNILTIREGKYAGLWVYSVEDEMDGSYIYFGKLVDGKVVFYGECDMPCYNYEDENRPDLVFSDGMFRFGKKYARTDEWGNLRFDLSRLTEAEFDRLYSAARPVGGQLYLVRVGGKEYVM